MTQAKPTFDQLFGDVVLPVKPSMKVTGANMTVQEFDNVDLSGPNAEKFGGMLANAGFKMAEESTAPTQRVVTI